jgi:hypothetical protein
MLDLGTYVAGSVSIVVVVTVLGWGCARVRQAMLPEWSGPPARLAEVVIAVATALGLAQILGSLGEFRRIPMLIAYLTAGIAMAVAGRRLRVARQISVARDAEDLTPKSELVARSPRGEVFAAAVALAVVASQWTTHVADALHRGMTHADTVWYHGPYAARFVQSGRVTGLLDSTDALHAFAGHNSELVHALFILPFGRDLLSPLVNMGWAALAILAAWCVGRRLGVAALCVLGVILVLGLPTVAGTHPGQASNDVAAGALLLAAVALLLEGELAPVPTGLAAAAAGLALGTKHTVAAPLVLLSVGVVALAFRARRPVVAAVWCVVLGLTGSCWFVRNSVLAHNPVPFYELHLGPVSLPSALEHRGESLGEYLRDGDFWRRLFGLSDGLTQAFGRAWPVVLLLALGTGVALVVTAGRMPLERLAGVAVLAGAVAHVFTPLTAGAYGFSFAFNLRYLTPVLLLGLALWPRTFGTRSTPWRQIACFTVLGLVLLNATAHHHERTPAWPSDQLVPGILAGVGVVVATAVVRAAKNRRSIVSVALAAAMLLASGIGAGWFVQRRYLEHRYVHAGLPLDKVDAVFRDLRRQKVAVFGVLEGYPIFGRDLSNRVWHPRGPTHGAPVELCRRWRQILAAGGYTYVVFSQQAFAPQGPAPEWIADDSATRQVTREGGTVVYRVDRDLNPDGCA